MINGKNLPKDEMTKVLNHLDKVFLGNGAMLLFKYPLMNKKMQELLPAIKDEVEAEGEGEASADTIT